MEPDLIEAYLATLRRRLLWHREVADVVDEVADHLLADVDRQVAAGVPPVEAQRRTLERFGDVDLVARSFAVTPAGGLAVPTRQTRAAGWTGLAAAASWLVALALGAAGGHTDVLVDWTLPRYRLWILALALACALTTVTVVGGLARAGRLRTPGTPAVVGAGLLLVVGCYTLGWAVTMLMPVLAVSAVTALRERPGARPDVEHVLKPFRLLAIWPAGAAALVVFDELVPVGPADAYGDHPIAWLVPFVLCTLVSATGLAVAGLRLRAERPVERPVDRTPVPV